MVRVAPVHMLHALIDSPYLSPYPFRFLYLLPIPCFYFLFLLLKSFLRFKPARLHRHLLIKA